jgi:hypothetical protein
MRHTLARGNEIFMDLMSQQDVDYVLCGHLHALARGERNGTMYVITGDGGAALYGTGYPQAYHHSVRTSVGASQREWPDVEVDVVPLSP